MDEYIKELMKINTVGEMFALLKRKLGKETDAALAAALELNTSTLCRMKTEEQGICNYKIENVERIVQILVKDSQNNEQEIRDKIYDLLYKPEIKKEKLDRLMQMRMSEQEQSEKKIIAEAECDSSNELRENMCDVVRKLVGEKERSIKEEKTSEYGDNVILFVLDEGCYSIFGFPIIDMIYAIGITEENYNEMLHVVVELDKEDGVIILFCSDMTVLDRAWRDEKIQVENNVVLYSLDGKRKAYVKSTRKKGKKALKYLFGDTNLVFSK